MTVAISWGSTRAIHRIASRGDRALSATPEMYPPAGINSVICSRVRVSLGAEFVRTRKYPPCSSKYAIAGKGKGTFGYVSCPARRESISPAGMSVNGTSRHFAAPREFGLHRGHSSHRASRAGQVRDHQGYSRTYRKVAPHA